MSNYFQIFNLPAQFALDESKLQQTYHVLAGQFHPDRVANSSVFEQKQALMMTATINEAYRTLKHPLNRAAYLLRTQHQIDADSPEHTQFAPEFLMQQLQWRETLAEARAEQNFQKINQLNQEIQKEQADLFAQMALAFQHQPCDGEHIAQLIRQGRFLDKLQQEITAALPEA